MPHTSKDTLGIYVHIPFCRSKCGYCDFYSLSGRESDMDRFCKSLRLHLLAFYPKIKSYSVDSLYFGGGTPTLLGEVRLCALLSFMRETLPLSADAEITMEANPDGMHLSLLSKLKNSGVNRLSIGVQSANDTELRALGRLHTFSEAKASFFAARTAGFQNISLDLMYGIPKQTLSSWEYTLEQVLALAPEHLSCYGLKLEPNTPLFDRVSMGKPLPDDDLQADMYLRMAARLSESGFRQYEVSNFAAGDFISHHNMKYWTQMPYLGFGPGAHSDFGGHRFHYDKNLDHYLRAASGCFPVPMIYESPLPGERVSEYLMLGLRTADGISAEKYEALSQKPFAPLAEKLLKYESLGLSQSQGARWRLTPRGFLLSNLLIGELCSLSEKTVEGTA